MAARGQRRSAERMEVPLVNPWFRMRGARHVTLVLLVVAGLLVAACRRLDDRPPNPAESASSATQAPPASLPMGGEKSVMTFFVTSRGIGNGGDLGGLASADAHGQMLADAEGAGDHTWRGVPLSARRRPTPSLRACP